MPQNIKFTLDKYTKVVLTTIAVCLVLIVVNLYFGPKNLNAYETVQDVNLKSINGSNISGSDLPVNFKSINGSGISGSEIPVNMKKISADDELQVDIKYVNGRNIFGDKIPVDIQAINGQFIVGGMLPVQAR